MKFYLSSYKIGKETEKLKDLARGKTIGFIPNAIDFVDVQERKQGNKIELERVSSLDIDVEMLDLQEYFGKKEELKKKIDSLDGVWIRGGNVFVLRQAVKLSGFDEIVKNIERNDFLYGGYSAGICILAPSLKALERVDDTNIMPYEESKEVIWNGLGILDYIILPHYKSDHPESAKIDKVVEFCKKNNIPFKTLRDGEVIIIE